MPMRLSKAAADIALQPSTDAKFLGGGVQLPLKIEHIYPDYSIYGIEDTAYGFLTRGCPRQCSFCHVAAKEGSVSKKVADLSEFWRGQHEIVLMDPNILACKDHTNLLEQLADSKAYVDFNQGIDARLLTDANIDLLRQIKTARLHFAWDRLKDEELIVPKLKKLKEITGIDHRKLVVYVLTNFDSTHEQDVYRVELLRDMGFNPYVMIYNKANTHPRDKCRLLQRYVNNRRIFNTISFAEYDP